MTNQVAKKRKIVSLDTKKARSGWLFILPFVIGFVFLYFPMLCQSIQFSFCDLKILQAMRRPTTVSWIGTRGKLMTLKLNVRVRNPRSLT